MSGTNCFCLRYTFSLTVLVLAYYSPKFVFVLFELLCRLPILYAHTAQFTPLRQTDCVRVWVRVWAIKIHSVLSLRNHDSGRQLFFIQSSIYLYLLLRCRNVGGPCCSCSLALNCLFVALISRLFKKLGNFASVTNDLYGGSLNHSWATGNGISSRVHRFQCQNSNPLIIFDSSGDSLNDPDGLELNY